MNLSEVAQHIFEDTKLEPNIASEIIAILNKIIRDLDRQQDRDVYGGIVWEEALDLISKLGPQHVAVLPYLCDMVKDRGRNTWEDQTARILAIHAMVKMPDNNDLKISTLLEVINSGRGSIRREAIRALRKCNYKGHISFRWDDWIP